MALAIGVCQYQPSGLTAEIGIFIPAATRPMMVRDHTYNVPLPNLVFLGKENKYMVFAIKNEWPNRETRLYEAPTPNVFDKGGICAGELKFPVCNTDTIHKAFEMFIGSYFSNHMDTGSVKTESKSALTLWAELDEVNADAFPVDVLLPTHRCLGDVIGGL